LTELGRLMLPLLQQSYDSALAAKTLAESFHNGSCSPLHLALSSTINLAILVHPLTELLNAFPGLELKFFRGSADEIADALKNGTSELAVAGPLAQHWERFDKWRLFDEGYRLVINVANPLSKKDMIRLDELSQLRLLMRGYCEQADELSDLLASRGIVVSSSNVVASDQDLIDLLEADVGVGILPQTAHTTSNLKSISIEELEFDRTVYLYAVGGRQRSPAAAGLEKLLRTADWCAAIPGLNDGQAALIDSRAA